MPIIALVLWIALIGLAVWIIISYIPMPEAIKKLIVIVAVVAIVLWVITLFGLTSLGPAVPRLH